MIPLVALVTILLLPGAVLAAYPPGPFPGPGPAGAFPSVVVSKTVCGADAIEADSDGTMVVLEVPAEAFPACTQVTIYGASVEVLGPLIGPDRSLIHGYAVAWDPTGDAARPLTLTITDPTIPTTAEILRTSPDGLSIDTDAVVMAGSAATTLSQPIGIAVVIPVAGGVKGETAAPTVPPTDTGPGSGHSETSSLANGLIAGTLVLMVAMGLVMSLRRARRRG